MRAKKNRKKKERTEAARAVGSEISCILYVFKRKRKEVVNIRVGCYFSLSLFLILLYVKENEEERGKM